jgi:glutamate--cysteine ligase
MTASPEQFAALRESIHAECFSPATADARAIGAEVELLALDAERRPLPLAGNTKSLIPILERRAAGLGWHRVNGYDGLTRFEIAGRAVVSFEPGGQIEVSTLACESPSKLVSALDGIVSPLRTAMRDEGIELVSVGIDPHNDARAIPLQLEVPRYRRMTDYVESIGPFGIRMMRQTAAIQISVDRGAHPARRWRLLNDLAAYITAIFANSPVYLDRDTGDQSFRAHCWRQLDPTRTGVALDDSDAAGAYARFALGAGDMMSSSRDGRYPSFEETLTSGAGDASWSTHLSTLFPEVRPRGHFEVRSCDAIDSEWYAAPIVFVAALSYDEQAAREAGTLAAESAALLRSAGVDGLRDTSIARTARDLFQLALDGARRLGARYVDGRTLEIATEFSHRYTNVARAPADDRRAALRASVTELPVTAAR